MKHLQSSLSGFVVMVVLAACVPAVGTSALVYRASPADVLTAVTQFGPQLQPTPSYDNFSVEATSDTYITLFAKLNNQARVSQTSMGKGSEEIRVTVATTEVSQGTQVAVSVSAPSEGLVTQTVDKIIAQLNARLERVAALGTVTKKRGEVVFDEAEELDPS